MCLLSSSFFFFFNDTATTEIYTLSLHDALPISSLRGRWSWSKPPMPSCVCSASRICSRQPSFWELWPWRSEEHTSELQSHSDLVCRLLLEKKKKDRQTHLHIRSANLANQEIDPC